MRKFIVAATVSAALALGGCQSLFSVEAPNIHSQDAQTRLDHGLAVAQESLQSRLIAQTVRDGATEAERVQAYVALRHVQIDNLCAAFFGHLSEVQNQTQWGRDQFNILSEFGSVMLGLSGAPAEQLAVLAGVQLTTNDSIDAAERAMMLSPDPHKVYQLVLADQKNAEPDKAIPDYAEAERQVRKYAYPCTFLGIQAIIDRALQGQIDRKDPGGRNADVRLALDKVREALTTPDGPAISALPTSLVNQLYWLFVLTPAEDSPERAHLMAQIPEGDRAAVEAGLADDTRRQAVRTALETLGQEAEWVPTTTAQARNDYLRREREKAEAEAEARRKADADAAEIARLQAQRQAAEAERDAADAERRRLEAERAAAATPTTPPGATPPGATPP